MLRQLRTGGGLASSAAAAAAAAQALRESQSSLAAAAAACGNLSLLRHFSADASPSSSNSSSGGSSSSPVAEDPRWKSPLFDALLSLAARASSSPTSMTPSSSSTSPSATPTSSPPPPPPIRSVVAERHGLFDFLLDGARTAQARVLAHFIRSNVEASFAEREFLEGAADARHAVFDALSDDGNLAPLRGAVAPGLLRALHGLKEMHAAAGLAVRMTATEDDANGRKDSSSLTLRAELGVMGLLDVPLFEAMAEAVPGFEDLPPSIESSELEEKKNVAGSSCDEGSSSGSGSGAPLAAADASSSSDAAAAVAPAAAKAKPRSGLELSALDMDSFKEAVVAAHSKSGVFSGKYQVLAVRFTGGVLVRTFAKSVVASASSSSAKKSEEEEKASVAAAASKATASSPPPPPHYQAKPTTLTLVRELLDKRPHLWRFVRGPLPEGLPVRQLALPWTLLSIDLD